MDRQEIQKQLFEILINDFEIEEEDLSLDSNLYEDLDFDSIDAVDLVVKLSKLTGKKVEAEVFKQVRTVGDVVTEINKLLAE